MDSIYKTMDISHTMYTLDLTKILVYHKTSSVTLEKQWFKSKFVSYYL